MKCRAINSTVSRCSIAIQRRCLIISYLMYVVGVMHNVIGTTCSSGWLTLWEVPFLWARTTKGKEEQIADEVEKCTHIEHNTPLCGISLQNEVNIHIYNCMQNEIGT